MRNDERYNPKPQSGQLEIFGLGSAGEQDFQEARKWIDENPTAWSFMVEQAIRLNRKGYEFVNKHIDRELVEKARRDEAEQAAKRVVRIIFCPKED